MAANQIGPSTTQTSYLVPTDPAVSFTSILSAGDQVPGSLKADGTPWKFVGTPDGLGAYDNGDGTFTVLVNHEIGPTAGVVRAHGSAGAFVDRLVIDKQTLAVVSAGDLGKTVFTFNATSGTYVQGTTAFNRLCSADLPATSAFYDATTGLGTQARIFMNGEEAGAEGRAFGWVATGPSAGTVYELPRLGKFSWENSVANPFTGAKTVTIGTDDATPGQLYLYAGDKQATGTEVDKAGLTNGKLYGIKVPSFAVETTALKLGAAGTAFTIQEIGPNGDASKMTGAQIQAESSAEGVTEFLRPEDGAWDPTNANRFYFNTTDAVTAPSRLWALDFVDAKRPELGGTIKMLLDGTEGQVMLDNMTLSPDGKVILQEDVGNNARLGKVWEYDPVTDKLTQLAEHDPARFSGLTTPFNQDEESSGVVDVTSILGSPGKQAFLIDVQAHYAFGNPEIVEGGQLQLMTINNATQQSQLHAQYRFYNTKTGDHFITANGDEFNQILKTMPDYHYEGVVGATPDKGVDTQDVFRFFNTKTGDHFYTASTTERDLLQKSLPDYHYEGVAFEAYANPATNGSTGETMERFYNTKTGLHMYTADANEISQLKAGGGWVDEGRAFTVHVATTDGLLLT